MSSRNPMTRKSSCARCEREAAAQRELLESFLARYREASARTDANYLPADARIISRAVPPIAAVLPEEDDDGGSRRDRDAAALLDNRAAGGVYVGARVQGDRLRRTIRAAKAASACGHCRHLPTYPGPVERAAVEASRDGRCSGRPARPSALSVPRQWLNVPRSTR